MVPQESSGYSQQPNTYYDGENVSAPNDEDDTGNAR